jgi:hypothetical protein
VPLCVGTELIYREAMHVYAAAGGTRARMGLHARTAEVIAVQVMSGRSSGRRNGLVGHIVDPSVVRARQARDTAANL